MEILEQTIKQYEKYIKLMRIKDNEVVCVYKTINDVLVYPATEAEAKKYCEDAYIFHDGEYMTTEIAGKKIYAWVNYTRRQK